MKDENKMPEKWNWQDRKDRPKTVKEAKPKKEPKPKKEAKAKPSGGAKVRGKKIWIWLTLLIVAAAIGIGVYFWLSASKTYTVTVTLGNGEVIKVEEQFKEGASLNDTLSAYLTDAPTGYEYVWEGLPEDGKMPNGDLTVTAVLKAKKYTLTFDTDGGNTVASRQVDYNTAIGALLPPTKTGHTFVNWVKAGTGEEVTAATLMPLNGLSIQAAWRVNSYKLTYVFGNGDSAQETEGAYGAAMLLPMPPTLTGYTFTGWLDGDGNAVTAETRMPAGDLTVTAQWTVNRYTLTFDTNGGNEIAAYKLEYNTALGNLEKPVKTGHTFVKWVKSGTETEVTADTLMPVDGLTIQAVWVANSYTLTFDTDGGNVIDSREVDYEIALGELPTPVKTGYTFSKWVKFGTVEEVTAESLMPVDGLTLQAVWTANPYSLAFDTDGGTFIVACNVDYDTPLGAQLPTPVKKPNPQTDEYGFIKWVATINGVETEVTPETRMPLGGLTVKAQWFELSNLVFTPAYYNKEEYTVDRSVALLSGLDVVIPASYNGKPVTGILGFAFGSRQMKSVRIPSTVKEIGPKAFENCKVMTSVVIPEGVTGISNGVFGSCESLQSVTIPGSVTSIGEGVFAGCTKLRSVTILGGVTEIKDSAFYNCVALTSVELPEGLLTIGTSAFQSCASLTSITIPESVTTIMQGAFINCGLTSITIPGGVTGILPATFILCDSLTSVILSDGVTSIEERAFEDCTGLTSVIIPKSVTGINNGAFKNCIGLMKIYYTGTPTDKAGLTVSATDNDAILVESSWYYYSATEPDPTDTNKYWHYGTDGKAVEWKKAVTV